VLGDTHRDSAERDTPAIEILSHRISNLPLWCRVPGVKKRQKEKEWVVTACSDSSADTSCRFIMYKNCLRTSNEVKKVALIFFVEAVDTKHEPSFSQN